MNRRAFGIVCSTVLAFALVAIAPAAKADALDQGSRLTFNEPVALPGNVILPAGTYWFVFGNGIGSLSPSALVRVYDADRTDLITKFTTISTTRSAPPASNGQITFAEQSRRGTIALLDLYYAGTLTGHEFVYSPQREAELRQDPQITMPIKSATRNLG